MKSKDQLESRSKSTKKLVLYDKKMLESTSDLLETRLEELSKSHRENGISFELFEKFQECFEEVIAKYASLGGLLNKIKSAYHDWIKFKTNSEISSLRSEIIEYRKRISEELEENKLLHRKIQKFSRENVELARNLDEKDKNFQTLQEYLVKVTNINIDSVPQDKISWKVVVAENKSYSDLCEKLKKKLKSMKKRQNKLMKLFWFMKQKGYPVEELHSKLQKPEKAVLNVSITELSDNEPINIEPAKSRPKPGNVPVLQMDQVEPNSFTEQESESSECELSLG
jgi:DNA repair exonuclease SbcCD ATPase subunit